MAKSISVVVTGNAAPLRKALGDTDEMLKKSFGGIQKAALAGAAAMAGAGALAYSAIQDAADLSETLSKAGVLFGDNVAEIEKFADGAARSMGMTKQAALDASATFATFGKSAGLSGKDLSKFSTDFVSLASDLSSFNNTTPEEAINAIGSALRGEAEPMRKYGVLLDDATMRQKALELGIIETTKQALTPQQKVLAAQALIMEKTADAQGDFERTSGSLVNQQKILSATLTDVKAKVGNALLPAFLGIVTTLNDVLFPAIEKVTKIFEENGFVDGMKMIFEEGGAWLTGTGLPMLQEKLGQLGGALVDWIGPRIGPMLEKLGELIAAGANWLLDTGLPTWIDKLKQWGQAFVDWIGPNIAPMLQKLGELIAKIAIWALTDALPKLIKLAAEWALALTGWVLQLAPQIIKGLGLMVFEIIKKVPEFTMKLVGAFADLGVAMGKGLVNGIIGLVNLMIKELNDLLEFSIPVPFGPDIKVNAPDLPSLPRLAEGGLVMGPQVALIGEAGPELVVPFDKMGKLGGGNTYSITVQTGVGDPREIGRQVVDAIRQYERTAGPVFQAA